MNTEDGNDISKICFSENGYYFVSTSLNSNSVNLWDLRKRKIIREIRLPEKSPIEYINFDNFGNTLGICADYSYVYNIKTFELINNIEKSRNCKYIKFDRDMEFFMTANSEGNISTSLIYN